ncbi:MAG: DUF21 domain-containing protein [Burkholderiales bacterium]|nr:DUF21 domain-containing protein [Burkholderiales bacterium]
MNTWMTWLGITLCIAQAGTFSGLNLAVFSLSRLRLEAAASAGSEDARQVLTLRQDANTMLATILWGNVAINVLLTLLANSVMAGVAAFLFSTVVLTMAGEILPQAWFSRRALRVAARLAPMLHFYRFLLWPLARPTGRLLDALVGPETIPWFREDELRHVLHHHAGDTGSELSRVEATGAINFLALDDIAVGREGEPLDPYSVISLPMRQGRPVFPAIAREAGDPFLARIAASGKKWLILADEGGEPHFALNAHDFLLGALFGGGAFDPAALCHRPLVVRDPALPLGQVLGRLTVHPEKPGDDVVDLDVILLWTSAERRIITGSDLLGRLLRGIVQNPASPAKTPAQADTRRN